MKRATTLCKICPLRNIISIHALVKRATTDIVQMQKIIGISIHALVKRATSIASVYPVTVVISIHALVKRATQIILSVSKHFIQKFQSTPS